MFLTQHNSLTRDRQQHDWQLEQEKIAFERSVKTEKRALLRTEYLAMLQAAVQFGDTLADLDYREQLAHVAGKPGPFDIDLTDDHPYIQASEAFQRTYTPLRLDSDNVTILKFADNLREAYSQWTRLRSQRSTHEADIVWESTKTIFDELQRAIQERMSALEIAE